MRDTFLRHTYVRSILILSSDFISGVTPAGLDLKNSEPNVNSLVMIGLK
jgi:hypothetical protein